VNVSIPLISQFKFGINAPGLLGPAQLWWCKTQVDRTGKLHYIFYKMNVLFTGADNLLENREPGDIPGRTRHCIGEQLSLPLLLGEGTKLQ
jgi:hypothetical protein